MFWQKWSQRLKDALQLRGEPVAVTFASAPAPGASASRAKVSVCQALRRASEGEEFAITVETCGCPGGLVSLGLGQTTAQGRERLVEFLVNKEKVYCSRMAIHRGQQSVPSIAGAATHVLFSPLSRAASPPDVVAFLGTPGSLHHLIGLAGYWDGGPMTTELSGPACRSGIAYPAMTGEIGVSLLDFGARRLARFAADQMLVAVPLHRMIGIVHALDEGFGASRESDLEAAERQIDELGRVAPA